MLAKQLSVFIENRQGRLSEVLNVLKQNSVNILSISLADTTEYGLLRLIVNDAEKGKDMLAKEGFSSLISDILIVEIPHKAGSLQSLLEGLDNSDINVEYMYGLSINGEGAFVVLKASNLQEADKIISSYGVKTVSTDMLTTL